MIKLGVIGCGHWGPNHIRVFSQMADSRVEMCADLDEKKLAFIKELFPTITGTTDYHDLFNNKDIDAVCIAAPTDLHYKLAKEALNAGKHVLCEKPLAMKDEECRELHALANKTKKVLMVGHIFLFNAGIRWLKEYIASGELGKIHYAYATRTNLGPFRYDVNALWDLAPHDISIFNYLFGNTCVNASARGHKALGTSLDDLTFATLEYPDNIAAHIHVSWLDPRKVRQITIVGEKKMVIWDDLDNLGPIKLYDKYVEKTSTFYATYGEFQLLSKEGSITIPKISMGEPLKAQAQHFLDCVVKNKQSDICDAQGGLGVVQTLNAIQESMDQQGACVALGEKGAVAR